MVNSLEFAGEGKTPGSALTDPGAVAPSSRGSRNQRDIQIVIFLSMEELIVHGPQALRPWLARRLMTLKRGPGTVVEFHQPAIPSDGGSQ
jgi:hypothetical protein